VIILVEIVLNARIQTGYVILHLNKNKGEKS